MFVGKQLRLHFMFYYSTFFIHTCLNIKILSAGTFKLSRYVGYMNDYVEVMFRITAFCVGIFFDFYFCAKYCFSTKLYIFEIRKKEQIKEHWHNFDLILKYIRVNSKSFDSHLVFLTKAILKITKKILSHLEFLKQVTLKILLILLRNL